MKIVWPLFTEWIFWWVLKSWDVLKVWPHTLHSNLLAFFWKRTERLNRGLENRIAKLLCNETDIPIVKYTDYQMLRNFEVSNLMKLRHMGSLICHCELLMADRTIQQSRWVGRSWVRYCSFVYFFNQKAMKRFLRSSKDRFLANLKTFVIFRCKWDLKSSRTACKTLFRAYKQNIYLWTPNFGPKEMLGYI